MKIGVLGESYQVASLHLESIEEINDFVVSLETAVVEVL